LAAAADIVLLLRDPGTSPSVCDFNVPAGAAILRVGTKSDLLDSVAERRVRGEFDVLVSTRNGAGLSDLLGALTRLVEQRFGGRELALITRHRHLEVLQRCAAALERSLCPGIPLEIAAEELRSAADALARVNGRIDVEEWLDVIFSEFCIGK
jgi:tRNA modification GTPase